MPDPGEGVGAVRAFCAWCRGHLTGYITWPPVGLSIAWLGLFWLLLLGSAAWLPCVPWLLLPCLYCLVGAAAVGLVVLWSIAWIVADKWERTSAYGILVVWAVLSGLLLEAFDRLLRPTDGKSRAAESAAAVCSAGILVGLFFLRSYFRHKMSSEQGGR
jgi:hypothetical protein